MHTSLGFILLSLRTTDIRDPAAVKMVNSHIDRRKKFKKLHPKVVNPAGLALVNPAVIPAGLVDSVAWIQTNKYVYHQVPSA
jgi:hypothetical protein